MSERSTAASPFVAKRHMPITFECKHCTSSLSASDGAAGSVMRCPACNGSNRVPGHQAAAEVPLELDDEPDERADAPERASPNPWKRRRSERGPWRGPTGQWLGFARGCGFVRWGVVFELGALALLFVLLELLVLDAEGVLLLPNVFQSGELILAVFLPLATGTVLSAIGRVMMVGVPTHTPGIRILITAAGLNWLRFILLVGAIVLFMIGFLKPPGPARVPYFEYGLLVCLLAGCAALITELSAIPALALVGGEIPSLALRSRAAQVAFHVQLLAAAWITVAVIAVSRAAVRELALQQGAPAPRPLGRGGRIALLTGLLAFEFALAAAYYFWQYQLYSTGQGAGQSDGDRDS